MFKNANFEKTKIVLSCCTSFVFLKNQNGGDNFLDIDVLFQVQKLNF